MNIILYEQAHYYQNMITEMLHSYFIKRNTLYQFTYCNNENELLQSDFASTHLVFVSINDIMTDIHMLIKYIRKMNKSVLIILIAKTLDKKTYIDGYELKIFRYLIDDYISDKLYQYLDAAQSILRINLESLHVKCNNINFSFYLNEIIFIESDLRKLTLHSTTPPHITTYYGKISEIEQQLCNKGFLRVHKSFLVNVNYIKDIYRYSLILSDDYEIPVGDRKYKEVKNYLGLHNIL